jgi:PGF-CTERM protein
VATVSDRFRVVLAALVVLCALVGPIPVAAQDTGGTTDRPTASFNQSTVSEQRGDIAAISLTLSETSNATVTVGSEAVNYEANVTVNDSDGDGRVTLLMNTYIAGMNTENRVYAASEGDAVVRTNRTTDPLDSPLEASRYNLSIAVGDRRTGAATLALTERTTGELITWTAPAASFDNATNTSEVAAAVENGRITASDSVAVGDVSVNQFRLSGVYGAFAVANFTTLVESGALDFSMVQTNPATNRPPKRLDLNRSLANDSIRVVPDPQNDVLYVNVDTGSAVFENGTLAAGDTFESTLTLDGESALAATDESISANVTFVGTELGLADPSLAAGPNQTVTGTTSVAPGSEVMVRLQRNGSSSFVKTNTTRVKPNGSFTASFNLSTVAPQTTVSVRADGPLGTGDRTNVTVGPYRTNETSNGTASLAIADATTSGQTVTVRNATLPDGGFVVVHAPNVSTDPVGSVLGASSYLMNGSAENVTVSLTEPLREDTRVVVMAHTDSNDNQIYDFSSSNGSEDGPYTANGSPVTASAQLRVVATATPMATAATTAAGTAATTGATAATGTAAANETTNGGGPGFGIVAALVALSLAGLAWRR